MSAFESIRLERSGPAARITLYRPGIRNAFDDAMIRELREGFARARDDREVRAVVLTGQGSAFCAGADLHWMRRVVQYTYEQNYEDSLNLAHLLREIYECPKPVVCRVNGAAIGGGAGLVAVCDIAVAAETATFSFSELKIGLVPACVSPYVLRRVGERYAREYFLTGERLTAARALECGLVNRVVPADDLDSVVQALVEGLCTSGPCAVATCKQMVRQVSELDLDAAGPVTAEMIARLRVSEEGQEGMSAFLGHRKPSWWPAER